MKPVILKGPPGLDEVPYEIQAQFLTWLSTHFRPLVLELFLQMAQPGELAGIGFEVCGSEKFEPMPGFVLYKIWLDPKVHLSTDSGSSLELLLPPEAREVYLPVEYVPW